MTFVIPVTRRVLGNVGKASGLQRGFPETIENTMMRDPGAVVAVQLPMMTVRRLAVMRTGHMDSVVAGMGLR